jgi:hypothetical protein
MAAAAEAIREAVLRLLQEGEVDPQFVVLAAAGVSVGELWPTSVARCAERHSRSSSSPR